MHKKGTENQRRILRCQDFHPPRGWPVPFNKSKRSHNLGLKLTYGFEILLTGGGRKFNREAQLSSLEAWMVRPAGGNLRKFGHFVTCQSYWPVFLFEFQSRMCIYLLI